MTLCTRCGREPAVQGSPMCVRCLWPEPFTSRAAELAAEGDRLGDAFRARTAAMEHVPGCQCTACRPVRTPEDIRAEIFGRPPYSAKLKHGRSQSGEKGPCEPNCRKCALEDELARVTSPPPEEECARCGIVGPVDVAWGCHAFERDPRGLTDAGAATSPPPPCCRRIGASWCYLPDDGHPVEQCRAVEARPLGAADYGPGNRFRFPNR